jgi:hypothetical protein
VWQLGVDTFHDALVYAAEVLMVACIVVTFSSSCQQGIEDLGKHVGDVYLFGMKDTNLAGYKVASKECSSYEYIDGPNF